MLTTKEEIGKMDRRVTFQRKVYTTNASNERAISGWEDISTRPEEWANVEEGSGSEVIQGEQLTGLTTARITTRYRSDITIENRISYNSKYYDIHAIIEVGRRRFSMFLCESGGHYSDVIT